MPNIDTRITENRLSVYLTYPKHLYEMEHFYFWYVSVTFVNLFWAFYLFCQNFCAHRHEGNKKNIGWKPWNTYNKYTIPVLINDQYAKSLPSHSIFFFL